VNVNLCNADYAVNDGLLLTGGVTVSVTVKQQ
jgi:hypothetical protein